MNKIIITHANRYPFLFDYEKVKGANEPWIAVESKRQLNLILDKDTFEPLPSEEDSAKVFYLMLKLNSILKNADIKHKLIQKIVKIFLRYLTNENNDNLVNIAKAMGIDAQLSSFSIDLPSSNGRKPYNFSIDIKYLKELEKDINFVEITEIVFYKDQIYLTKKGLAELIMSKASRKICEILHEDEKDYIYSCVSMAMWF